MDHTGVLRHNERHEAKTRRHDNIGSLLGVVAAWGAQERHDLTKTAVGNEHVLLESSAAPRRGMARGPINQDKPSVVNI